MDDTNLRVKNIVIVLKNCRVCQVIPGTGKSGRSPVISHPPGESGGVPGGISGL